MTWQPLIDAYHADLAVGSTMMSVFRESPGLFYGRFVSKELPAAEMGRAGRLGGLLHAAIEGAELQVAEHNDKAVSSRNSKAYRKYKSKYGRLACTLPEAKIITGAIHRLANPNTPQSRLAKWLLVDCPGKREYSHRWTHPSGETCKVRFDVLPDPGEGLPGVEHCFVDLKFVENCTLDAFRRNTENFGLHVQGALYSQGYFDLRGEWPVVTYVVIGNAWPYPILVTTLSETFIEMGLDQVQKDLNGISECRKTGKWFSAEELESDTTDMEPSDYFLRKYQRNLDE